MHLLSQAAYRLLGFEVTVNNKFTHSCLLLFFPFYILVSYQAHDGIMERVGNVKEKSEEACLEGLICLKRE